MIELIIFMPGNLLVDNDASYHLAWYMLQGILGEYEASIRIGAIALRPASFAHRLGARPINDLAQAVDALGPFAPVH